MTAIALPILNLFKPHFGWRFSMLKNFMKKIIWVAALGVILGGGYYIFFPKAKEVSLKPAPSVRVQKIIRQDVEENIDLIGNLVAFETVSVKSRLDSQITEVGIVDGQKVEKGQKLFQLDDRVIKAQLEEAEANLKANQAEVDRAEKQFKRDSDLVKQGVTAQKQYDTSKQTFDAAKAAVAATQAKIDFYKTQLDFSLITSPIDGRVGSIKITQGNVVKANDTIALVVINKIDPIKVEVALPQRYFERLKKDNLKNIKIRLIKAGGQNLKESDLQSMDNQIDENTRSLIVRTVIDNHEEKLWPGMFVDVALTIEQAKNAMTIPLKSIQRTQKGDAVFVIKDNVAKLIPITAKFTSGENAVIEGNNLTEGDLVVIEGAFNLQDGIKATIIPEKSL